MTSKVNVRASNGTRWRKAKAALRAQRRGCWICRAFGRDDEIDYGAAPLDPRSFTADHLTPVSRGGALYDLANLDAAHRACNVWRGAKSVAEVLALARRERARRGKHEAVMTTTDW